MGNFEGFGSLREKFRWGNEEENSNGLEKVQQNSGSGFAEEYWNRLTLKAVPDDENKKNADATGAMDKYHVYHNDEKHFSIICVPEVLEEYQKEGIAPVTQELFCIFPGDWKKKGKYPHIQSMEESLAHRSTNGETLSEEEEEILGKHQEEQAKVRRQSAIIKMLREEGYLDELDRRLVSGLDLPPLLQEKDADQVAQTAQTAPTDSSVPAADEAIIGRIGELVEKAVQRALNQQHQSDPHKEGNNGSKPNKSKKGPGQQNKKHGQKPQSQPSPDDFDDGDQDQSQSQSQQSISDDFPFMLDENGNIPGLDEQATAAIIQQYEAEKKKTANKGGNA